jgi:succinate dehydrogenase cytochrome b556 subunit
LSSEQRARAYAEVWPANPRWGIWAWWAQRITGVALSAYAVWHIVTIAGAARHPERLAPLLQVLRHPVVFGVLLASLAYHSANGVRLALFDLGIEGMRRRRAFWGFLAAAALIVAAWLYRDGLGAR